MPDTMWRHAALHPLGLYLRGQGFRCSGANRAARAIPHNPNPRQATMTRNLAPQEIQQHGEAPRDSAIRKLCTHFEIWMICPQSRCRRGRACGGDPHDCFKRWWPHLPEDEKALLRLSIKARCSGLSPDEAYRAAEAEFARWKQVKQEWLPRDQACAAPAPAGAPADLTPAAHDGRTPRIRRL